MTESKKPLKRLRRKQNQVLAKYLDAIRGDLSELQRLKFKAITIIEIHARDVVEKMYKIGECGYMREAVCVCDPHPSSRV